MIVSTLILSKNAFSPHSLPVAHLLHINYRPLHISNEHAKKMVAHECLTAYDGHPQGWLETDGYL
jgi:hypothetical protein